MLHRFRQRFGTAGLIVSIGALVLALAGGAYAASGALTGKQKKEVEKIAKKYAGAPGATGANGLKGDAGAAGAPGAKGDIGATGPEGAAGKSIVLTGEPNGSNCLEGGTKVEVQGNSASKQYVCNGISANASGEVKGTYSVAGKDAILASSISFGTEFASAPTLIYVTALGEEEDSCPGTKNEPKAEPGFLCVYKNPSEGALDAPAEAEVLKFGANMLFLNLAETQFTAVGTWAASE